MIHFPFESSNQYAAFAECPTGKMHPLSFNAIPITLLLKLLLNFNSSVIVVVNKFLVQKIMPRQSGKRLLLYFGIVIVSVFIYITIGTYLIVGIAKLLQ